MTKAVGGVSSFPRPSAEGPSPLKPKALKPPIRQGVVIFFCLILLGGFTACDLTPLVGPLSGYLVRKVPGLTVKAERVVTGLRPLRLEATGVTVSYKKDLDSWEIRIPECRLVFHWSWTWEHLPWPEIRFSRISLHRPHLSLSIPHPRKGADWTEVLRKVPAFDALEIFELQGEVVYGNNRLRFSRGAGGEISFDPKEGGRVSFRLGGVEGKTASYGLSFQGGAQGSLVLTDFPKEPKFRGDLKLIQANLIASGGNLKGLSGHFHWVWEKHQKRLSADPIRIREMAWQGKETNIFGKGEIVLTGALSNRELEKPFWEWKGLKGKGEAEEFLFRKGAKIVRGRLSGEWYMDGSVKAPQVKARIALRNTDFSLPPVETAGLQADLIFQGQVPDFSISVTRAEARETAWFLGGHPLSLSRPAVRFTGEIQGKNRRIRLQDIHLTSAEWGTLSGELFF